ncbi:hypothetical protein [Acinetobacter puyangensis]|uniref:hypothetical protein n=1 Tax=Acinetobacter puyangensis TaxID=1096779 RepID=UPI003A4D1FB2
MTSLTIHLPDELAKRVEKTGVLTSPIVLQFLEKVVMQAEQKLEIQQQDSKKNVLKSAWACVQPSHSIDSIDHDLSEIRDEWASRP